ncbi:MAG: cyclic 2,3-diphosphoglycerate synthase [Lentimicrobium sp.]|jgi:predicted GTPase|uniref:cyclic 2,3-diphosphoglycerate synthase n=1 Tax=Lentimicrobium sp. TaxID=2034841 RepID=UPI0025ED070A|nr:cyclic 2,3-diphosphoglycerate synthase [Lentimicrobium sp.]MCO5255612.1 cyclic 2,3-diphosphoglycerate synthase [Lentimicrobium sp.]MCO5261574.1 cyclic 2,3-diphosphoglycerate synthase [Lentimicrobium sp.]HPF63482.1 cyclic 2,3-diphosphoglycerate synthase [Lentimicrobium sp.]HPJ61438.1 cyclic 2,3-diphosphoglycerate synthase [Lentimicrobium sp.]HRW67980.1 cyclic 2,3-diphosphoglycerate synthase [Lentimicrobium sp.]
MKKNVIIIGAAGRDFHNFNTYFRGNANYNVVAFTAAQIPDIDGRKYPKELAGEDLYPAGIPIHAEEDLPRLIKELKVDDCVFSYSDVPYPRVMNLSAVVNAAGANFLLLGPRDTMVSSTKPLIAVGATRTGCGKSQTSRRIIEILMEKGLKVVAVRHPMPYGDLNAQKVQRFATVEDLKKHKCTIEEMEEYEPHVVRGNVIYAGVDYEAILREAEKDPSGCDVILWDGGNNDFPFYKPDLMIGVADPLRPGAEVSYYPGEVVARMSDVIVINKIDSASLENINAVRANLAKVNPGAIIVDGASPLTVDKPELIRGKKVLVVEDGPTLTHGEMKIGAGVVAALKHGAGELVDPRPYTVGKLSETFRIYPNIGTLLPAMGYGEEQVRDLEKTIENTPCDAVVIATPIDLSRIVKINKPTVKVGYDLQEIGTPNLTGILDEFVKKYNLVK